jgi:hypothetical protein
MVYILVEDGKINGASVTCRKRQLSDICQLTTSMYAYMRRITYLGNELIEASMVEDTCQVSVEVAMVLPEDWE